MEAANRGAHDVAAKIVGLNITLPLEQSPNPYITPELCFQFHYFALRKMHFLLRAKALVVFPGGFGTLDELFDALTLRQTRRMQEIPIIMFGREYWEQVLDFQFLADEGAIADADLELIRYAETPEEAWQIIKTYSSIEAMTTSTKQLEPVANPVALVTGAGRRVGKASGSRPGRRAAIASRCTPIVRSTAAQADGRRVDGRRLRSDRRGRRPAR